MVKADRRRATIAMLGVALVGAMLVLGPAPAQAATGAPAKFVPFGPARLVDTRLPGQTAVEGAIGDNTARMMEHGIARAKEVLEAVGASDICINSPILFGGWHLLGTARMGSDPERSVVNEWGRSHDVKNLFIVDGSLFVTSGGVNPTSTIQALALYVADQMKQRLATLFD